MAARLSIAMVLTAMFAGIAAAQPPPAQRVSVPRHHHPWGRFSPGSWSELRKVTEELGEGGELCRTTTETKTTLIRVDTTGCELQVEATVEISGKRFRGSSKTIRVGYNGEGDSETAVVRKTADGQVEIGGLRIPCAVLESKITAQDRQQTGTMLYSDKVAPFILKRETLLTDTAAEKRQRQTLMETIAVEMPCDVLGEMKSAAHVRTVSTDGGQSIYTLEIVCPEVPGGIVSHSSKELNAAGEVVRRSTLELIAFGVNDGTQTTSRGWLFRRSKIRTTSGRTSR